MLERMCSHHRYKSSQLSACCLLPGWGESFYLTLNISDVSDNVYAKIIYGLNGRMRSSLRIYKSIDIDGRVKYMSESLLCLLNWEQAPLNVVGLTSG